MIIVAINASNWQQYIKTRKFAKELLEKIPNYKNHDHWQRLQISQMLSQERRIERYKIIYIWKVLEGKVPNCGIESYDNLRLGRLCSIPPITKGSTKIQTLRENSFQIKGPQLFNILPEKIRNMTNFSIDDFKFALDKFLSKILDEPNVAGEQYTPRACNKNTGRPSNSVIEQERTLNLGGAIQGG